MATDRTSAGPKAMLSTTRALAVGAVVVLVVVLGGGLFIGLSPLLCAALAAAVIAGTVFLTRARVKRAGEAGNPPGALAALGHYAAVGAATLLLIQVVPYGRAHSNPGGSGEPAWSSPRTRELMVNSCFSCHSNEVKWPWYSKVAPVSWAVTEHVDEGRGAVNFSDFVDHPGQARDAIEVIQEGSMPPGYFTRFGLHPEAKLTDAEVAELVAGLRATPGFTGRTKNGND